VPNDPFLVYYKAYSASKETERLLYTVAFPYRTIRVTEQNERQVMLLSEVSMRLLVVGAYSNHLRPQVGERFVRVSERASFRCAAAVSYTHLTLPTICSV